MASRRFQACDAGVRIAVTTASATGFCADASSDNFIVAAENRSRESIDQEDFAGAQAVAFGDFLPRRSAMPTSEPTTSRSVGRERIAHGAESIAVELRADHAAIAEDQRGRAVPRFLLARLLFAESAGASGRFADPFPTRAGPCATSRRPRCNPGADRISSALSKLAESLTPSSRTRKRSCRAEFLPERAFARAHPAAIGADRIDFAIVRDETERLRELPRRAGIRGIALVKNREGRDEIRACKIRVEGAKLQRREQAFINERSRRERTKINAGECARFDALAHQEKLAFQIGRRIFGDEKTLADQRQRGQGARAEQGGIGGHFAPAETAQSEFCC